MLYNKRGIALAMNTIVILVLAVLVLVALVMAFTGGFAKFMTIIRGYSGSELDSASNMCQSQCDLDNVQSFCCSEKELGDEEITCEDERLDVDCDIVCEDICETGESGLTAVAECYGNPDRCDILRRQDRCEPQAGCSWDGSACSGEATRCSALTKDQCASQIGCVWKIL